MSHQGLLIMSTSGESFMPAHKARKCAVHVLDLTRGTHITHDAFPWAQSIVMDRLAYVG